ncbi:MAG: thioredoxin family protein [Hyphomicrobium sp.]|uniref:thioredoxin family protein n=1 Tax=Hyphomicrobium sp. TaxID=82 RepID=UPI003D11DBB4
MAEVAPICAFGWKAADFRLPATDGNTYSLAELAGENGTLVMFICNHCPYVQAILDRLVRDTRDLAALGVASIAISSNDAVAYPEDSFPRMKEVAAAHAFPFPYLHDKSQQVARAYGAVCTPDFFGFNRDLELQYRGRLDASGRNPGPPDARRELFEAMRGVAATGRGPIGQIPSMGCSIKWKDI